jgi:hypothetical protein
MPGILVSGDSLPVFYSGSGGHLIPLPRLPGRQVVGHFQRPPHHMDRSFAGMQQAPRHGSNLVEELPRVLSF